MDKLPRLGVNIGKPMFGMLVGLDISFGAGSGVMLFMDRKMFGINWVLSFGNDVYSDWDYDQTSGFKFGIFKDIRSFSFGLEFMSREADYWDYDMGSASFITLKYKLRG